MFHDFPFCQYNILNNKFYHIFIYFLNIYCDDLFCSETEHMLVLFNAFVQNIVKGISDTVEYPFGDKGNPE